MNSFAKTAIAATAATALASGIYLSTRSVPDVMVVKSKSGKQVRIIYSGPVQASEEETDFGPARVLNDTVPPDALCNMVFEAKIIYGKERSTPDISNLENLLNAGTLPVLIGVTDSGTGIWHCLFKGSACLEIAELPGYIASEMHQLVKHNRKAYYLKVKAKDNAKKHEVFAGDPDADPEGLVHFVHGWAGRSDLNFSFYQNGEFITANEINERKKEGK